MADLIGNDILLYIGTAGSAPTTAVTQFKNPSFNLGDTTLVDTTTVGDGTKTNKPGTHAPAKLTFTLNFDPSETTHATLLTNKSGKTRFSFGLTTPDTGAAVFWANGYVESFEFSTDSDAPITASVTLTADSAYTFTA